MSLASMIAIFVGQMSVLSAEKMPVWQFPVLSSDLIESHCSVETNQVLVELTLSRVGEILNISVVKPSSIPELNEEAMRNIAEASPFSELADMPVDEAARFSHVIMNYEVPCKALK